MAVFLGTSARNIINGTSAADQIAGLDGRDDLFGLGGNDDISGGEGNDLIKGGLGSDRLFGDENDDTLISGESEPFGTSSTSFTVPNGGNDQLDGGSGNDRLIVTFDSRTVRAIGGSGNDTLQMGFDNNALQDFLDLFPSSFQTDPNLFEATIDLADGAGQYRFNGTSVAVNLTVTGVENIDGSAFSETLSGNAQANVINGGGGNDVLEGRGGADTLNGGVGRDRASYASSAAAVNVDLTRTTQIGGDAQGDRLISIEDVTGSESGDTIRGNAATNSLDGGGGNDVFLSSLGVDNLAGGEGFDTVDYSADSRRIVGGSLFVDPNTGQPILFSVLLSDGGRSFLTGIERINGTAQVDDLFAFTVPNLILAGGGGNDTYNVGHVSVDVLEAAGQGFDTVSTSVSYELLAGQEIEVLTFSGDTSSTLAINLEGNEFNNEIRGNNGNNTIQGGGGVDRLVGFGGIDRYFVDNELDQVVEDAGAGGADEVFSQDADFVLPSNVEILRVLGTGVAGTGNDANNLISGSSTDNLLDGAGGADRLIAVLGHDTFVLRRGEANGDTIDFVGLGSESSDLLLFVGYGRASEGASFQQLSLTQHQINSSDGLVHDVITLPSGVSTFGSFVFVDFQQRGSSGGDVLAGTARDDALFGLTGSDELNGGDGDDVLNGGVGDDGISGGAGNDLYINDGRNAGNDIYSDESGADTIAVAFSRLQSTVRSGDDLVGVLTDGTFTVVNHFNGRRIESVKNLDTGEIVVLADGLVGGDASGIITGSDKGETLDGRGGNDFLYGNGGKDTLLGGDGNDLLDGGSGKDVLVGGNGDDTMTGGKGDDKFVFSPGSGHDVVRDFEKGDDRIDLTAFDTSFRKLDDDRDGRLEDGEGDRHITVDIHHGDTILKFAGGSITIENVKGLGEHDFLL